MRILVSGASGLIGNALVSHLSKNGHEVIKLVRRKAVGPQEFSWNPASHELDIQNLGQIDAVINLSGAGVGDRRWTTNYKREILNSRVDATSTLVSAIGEMTVKPKVLVNASAIGFYGDRGMQTVDETSNKGEGFLADVVEDWEASAMKATSYGVRVVLARTGLVFTNRGGALAKLLPLFKLGLGGKIAGGNQYWSFISLEDEIRAIYFLLENEISGPVNLTSPSPATNAEVTNSLGRALKRPTLLAVPGFALHLVLGEFASEITGGVKVLPMVLQKAGFTWNHPTIDDVVSTVI